MLDGVTKHWVDGRPKLCFEECGEGPPVVLLHGIGGNKRNWREQQEAIAQAKAKAQELQEVIPDDKTEPELPKEPSDALRLPPVSVGSGVEIRLSAPPVL